MELDEMKKAWIALDDISRENKSLKENIILKMIERKMSSSTSKLLSWEIFNLITLFFTLCFCSFFYQIYKGAFFPGGLLLIYAGVVCAVEIVWDIYKINGLMKVNFSQKVSRNLYYINRYNIQLKREKIIAITAIAPIFILTILIHIMINATVYSWIFMICLLSLAAFIIYWAYKYLYPKNINEILRSLDEIKEIKEE